ncbi:uncharacterized protein LOC120894750 [Anopheles arabiensis]|uniref:Uncharacterized protein n=1 Tax=Anopheles arabiensis TaxID=7173 RepID=A0A182HZN9_ANOAR|nr:uncharacterized protein LOC120894750 [Anopheles arabiensis]
MSSRKSRLSLSKDFHKDKDVKTPNARRTSARTSLAWKSPETHRNGDSCEVSPSQSSDYSPLVSLTQDSSFHAINGVSWEWNSPQRLREQQSERRVTVTTKPPLRPKYTDTVPHIVPKKPTGFNKFISKLNLLMEKENLGEQQLSAPVPETSHEHLNADESDSPHEQQQQQQQDEQQQLDLPGDSCFMDDFFVNVDSKETAAISNSGESDDDIFQEHVIATPVKTSPSITELDDSKLDNLLIEASQTIEQKLNQPTVVPPTLPPLPPVAVETKKAEPNLTIPIEMNDSDMDGFLIQASLMVEEKLSDSSQESTSHGNNAQKKATQPGGSFETTNSALPPNTETKCSATSNEGTSEITMSQEELKALIEKKRQEALRRLQNNRLKRGMKGPSYHG